MATFDAAVDDGTRTRTGLLVDTAEIPGGGELRLLRYEPHFEIMFGKRTYISTTSRITSGDELK